MQQNTIHDAALTALSLGLKRCEMEIYLMSKQERKLHCVKLGYDSTQNWVIYNCGPYKHPMPHYPLCCKSTTTQLQHAYSSTGLITSYIWPCRLNQTPRTSLASPLLLIYFTGKQEGSQKSIHLLVCLAQGQVSAGAFFSIAATASGLLQDLHQRDQSWPPKPITEEILLSFVTLGQQIGLGC